MDGRIPTGIEGFDLLVQGGFPAHTVNLVAGPAGSGKSLFALHFPYNGARRCGEAAMYLVLEEAKASRMRGMGSFGMGYEDREQSERLLRIELGALRGAGRDGPAVR